MYSISVDIYTRVFVLPHFIPFLLIFDMISLFFVISTFTLFQIPHLIIYEHFCTDISVILSRSRVQMLSLSCLVPRDISTCHWAQIFPVHPPFLSSFSTPDATTCLAHTLSASIPKLDAEGKNWVIFAEGFQNTVKAKGFWGLYDGGSTSAGHRTLNSIQSYAVG